MKIYLAARYSRRLELCGYRDQLRAIGHTVEAVWLNGEHQISDTGTPIGEHGEALVEAMGIAGREAFYGNADKRAAELRRKFAHDDYDDVRGCDLCISFTEPPRSDGRGRGGRHVEFGIALALGKLVWIVGPRENIFHWLPRVSHFEIWPDALAALEAK